MNDFFGIHCNDSYGHIWLGSFTFSWQNSLGAYSYTPHRIWGNTMVIINGREFIFH